MGRDEHIGSATLPPRRKGLPTKACEDGDGNEYGGGDGSGPLVEDRELESGRVHSDKSPPNERKSDQAAAAHHPLLLGTLRTLTGLITLAIPISLAAIGCTATWPPFEQFFVQRLGCPNDDCKLPYGGGSAEVKKLAVYGFFGWFFIIVLCCNSWDNPILKGRGPTKDELEADQGVNLSGWMLSNAPQQSRSLTPRFVVYVFARFCWALFDVIPVYYAPTANASIGLIIATNAFFIFWIGSTFLWGQHSLKVRLRLALNGTGNMLVGYLLFYLGFYITRNTGRLLLVASVLTGLVYPVAKLVGLTYVVESAKIAYSWKLEDVLGGGASHLLGFACNFNAGYGVPSKVRIVTFATELEFWTAMVLTIFSEVGLRLGMVYMNACFRATGDEQPQQLEPLQSPVMSDADQGESAETQGRDRTDAGNGSKEFPSKQLRSTLGKGQRNGPPKRTTEFRQEQQVYKSGLLTEALAPDGHQSPTTAIAGAFEGPSAVIPAFPPPPSQSSPKPKPSPTPPHSPKRPTLSPSHRSVKRGLLCRLDEHMRYHIVQRIKNPEFRSPMWFSLHLGALALGEYISLGLTFGLIYFHGDSVGLFLVDKRLPSSQDSISPSTSIEGSSFKTSWQVRMVIYFVLELLMDAGLIVLQRKQGILWEHLPPFNAIAYVSGWAFMGCTMCAFLTVYKGLLET
ncbi:uncharacterized protein EV422DRAFT_600692 [Fimicolochytrium jonesii]|uniref:uncharacterized protein n=1 Tax=Fimicolochytrium jonesii TaxID=1396493 RepID=UPI0022FE0323|nr:uncharacterized protein EV422DRAFT_600692 [Fimicolochytrium jonesii]KAI8825938.1 hypothetical protein EV422DRAFT_600692 [Fimicolochytrium jonesii]